jgi:hypothetical protein
MSAIEVERRLTLRMIHIHTNVGPASEDLPLTNTDRDVEQEADSLNFMYYAHTCNFLNLPDRVGGKP